MIDKPLDKKRIPICRVYSPTHVLLQRVEKNFGRIPNGCALDLYKDYVEVTSSTPIEIRKQIITIANQNNFYMKEL